MPQSNTAKWLTFALQQMAAESYLNNVDFASPEQVIRRLLLGNNSEGFPDTGATRMTGTITQGQAHDFAHSFQIIDHHANDATGFSATLMRDRTTGEYTLSFRSTEAKHQAAGGDWERDGLSGADGEIAQTGFALAQLVSMEKYYRSLKADPTKLPAGAVLNVTGYSLGGHLATVFTELHASEVNATYTFNGAGRGRIHGGTTGVPEGERIRQMLEVAETQLDAIDPSWFNSGSMVNVYTDQQYQDVRQSIVRSFNTTRSLFPPGEIGTGPGLDRITQLVGLATHNDGVMVANSGIHGRPITIFIEDQPDVEGISPGLTHSITLIVDSLALNELFQSVDGSLQKSTIEEIFAASSSQSASGFVGMSGVAEGNSLEQALDTLGGIFVPNYTPTLFGRGGYDFGNIRFRNFFYDNIQSVKAAVGTEKYQIVSVATKSSSEIFAAARQANATGVAYRYALKELNPFAVVGADYSAHNQPGLDGGALDLYDGQTAQGAWTLNALNDRAELLAERLKFALADGTPSHASAVLYEDKTTFFDNGRSATATQVVIFGGSDNDPLDGRLGNDRLYGGGGEDILSGFAGQDYLEGGADDDILDGGSENDVLLGQQGVDRLLGGAGHDHLDGGLGEDRLEGGIGTDTYFYRTGHGQDVIADSDRLGIVRFDNQILQGGLHRVNDPAGTYRSLDGQFIYVRQGSNLVINNALTIENFDFVAGQLGIKLATAFDTGIPSVPTIDYGANGFAIEEILLPAAGSWTIERVEAKNYIFVSGQGSYRIYAGSGNDQLYGGPNNDRLSSRSGDDLLQGFGGNDDLYGWEDSDVLEGGDGNDRLYADMTVEAAGQDYLDGGMGDDLLMGGSSNDFMLGGIGNDALWGDGGATDLTIIPPDHPELTGFSVNFDFSLGTGNDSLDGGAGDDTLVGSGGADSLLGGDGVDVLYGDHNGGETFVPWDPEKDGEDYLDGGAGNDWMYGGGLADVLIGGSGDDSLFGEGVLYQTLSGGDWLEGRDGNDQLWGGLAADALFGGAGNDLLVGDNANEVGADDMLDGGAGIDELQGGGGNDLLLGGSDNDWLFGQEGDDLLSGDAGDDELQGGLGADGISGGADNDSLFGQDGDDLLSGEDGDDLLNGGTGNDQLDGGDGIDDVQGREGDDVLVGGTGNDFLYGDGNNPTVLSLSGGNDILEGEDGDDQLWAGAGEDQLFGGEGRDQLVGDVGDDHLYGEAGDDVLFGDTPLFIAEAGADALYGGEGNDVLQGGGGDDDLHGGIGDDRLIGGGGLDTYRFNLGDGIDVIEDNAVQANRLVFGGGITLDSLSLDVAPADTLVLRVGNGGDSIQITGFGLNGPADFHTIRQFEFADGTVVTDGELLARGFQLSSPVTGGSLQGTSFADHIQGSQVGDWLYGRGGNDVMLSGLGDDVLEGEEGDDELDGGDGNDRLYGNEGNNLLRGGEGNDILDSAGLGDQLFGGAGDDAYHLRSIGDQVITEDTSAGQDTVYLTPNESLTFQAPDNVENVRIEDDVYIAPTIQVNVVGNVLDNELSGSHRLDGQAGNDTLIGTGDNTFMFGRGYGQDVVATSRQWYSRTGLDRVEFLPNIAPAELIVENHGNDLVVRVAGTTDQLTVRSYFAQPSETVDQFVFADGTAWELADIESRMIFIGSENAEAFYGTVRDDIMRGLGGNDQIRADAGNDVLDGGIGNDFLEGFSGNDVYVFGRGYGQDWIDEQGDGADIDTLQLIDGITPGDITLQATPEFESTALLTIKNTADQVALGGFFFSDGARIDRIQFSDGTIWDYSTMLAHTEGVNLVGTEEADYFYGNVTNDTLLGLGGDDTLSGGAGNDTLDGGTGEDLMTGGTGNDVYAVDNLNDVVTEKAGQGTDTVQSSLSYVLGANLENLTLIGGAAINGTGNSLNNTLVGNSAINVLAGGAGNDTYFVGVGDTITEAASAGTDTVKSDITWTLGANLENLILTGVAAINATGNSHVNTLTGNSAANTLSGEAGADTLIGAQGDDLYIVDNVGDKVTELAGEGLDTIQSSVTFTLGANVENLTLMGSSAVNGTGNGLDNVLAGNSAANRLTGGTGNDTYVVGTGDTVIEAVNAGIDTVQSSVTHTLAANVENLTLTGTGVINGTGNILNNILVGNTAANTLAGGGGNDTYIVSTGDTVTEQANAGMDTVQSSVTWTLGANVENLSLSGVAAINATGNTLANVLIGNAGHNTLSGGDGNDTLSGGKGNDALNGGTGNDMFQLTRGDGQDTITDGSGTGDRLSYATGINPLDLMLSQSANDLRIAVYGSTDQVTIANWYAGAANQIETVQAGNGQQLMSTQVNQLIQAMAGFTQQTGLSWDQAVAQRPQDVQQILAANWQ